MSADRLSEAYSQEEYDWALNQSAEDILTLAAELARVKEEAEGLREALAPFNRSTSREGHYVCSYVFPDEMETARAALAAASAPAADGEGAET